MTHRLLPLLLVVALATALAACTDNPVDGLDADGLDADGLDVAARVAPAADNAVHTYKVTLYNLTEGQVLSPGILATHTAAADLFEIGEPASEGIRLIAEDGSPGTAVGMASSLDAVFEAKNTGAGVPPGNSATFYIDAAANANHLSLAVMIVCTNDGFTGLDSVRLPRGFQKATFYADGYDAGTEQNLETAESIIDGCPFVTPDGMNTRPVEGGVITHHPGVSGGEAVPSSSDWDDPIAKITVQRMK